MSFKEYTLNEGKKVKLSKSGDISIAKTIANHITIRDDDVGAVISIHKDYFDALVDFIESDG